MQLRKGPQFGGGARATRKRSRSSACRGADAATHTRHTHVNCRIVFTYAAHAGSPPASCKCSACRPARVRRLRGLPPCATSTPLLLRRKARQGAADLHLSDVEARGLVAGKCAHQNVDGFDCCGAVGVRAKQLCAR